MSFSSPTLIRFVVGVVPLVAPNLLVLKCGLYFRGTWTRILHEFDDRRRAAASQVSRPNSTRAAGAGGSSNTMLKLYTDDSPGLRVYVPGRLLSTLCWSLPSEIHLLSSFFLSLSSARSSSSISLPKLFALLQNNLYGTMPRIFIFVAKARLVLGKSRMVQKIELCPPNDMVFGSLVSKVVSTRDTR